MRSTSNHIMRTKCPIMKQTALEIQFCKLSLYALKLTVIHGYRICCCNNELGKTEIDFCLQEGRKRKQVKFRSSTFVFVMDSLYIFIFLFLLFLHSDIYTNANYK